MLTATGGSVIPTAIAVGSQFWLTVGIAATVVGVVAALHGAPLKASSRGGGTDASPDSLDWTAQVDDTGDQPLFIVEHRGTNLGAVPQFSDFECYVMPPYGMRSKEPGRMTGTLIVAQYDPAPFPGVPRLFSAKYK